MFCKFKPIGRNSVLHTPAGATHIAIRDKVWGITSTFEVVDLRTDAVLLHAKYSECRKFALNTIR